MRNFWTTCALAAVILSFVGCAAVEMPEVDLSEPQWRVYTGQALWKPPGRMELTGDLVAAENTTGDVWVSMTKSLLPIFTARIWKNAWSIDFVERGQSRQGRGKPPFRRFIWFHLPKIIAGFPPPVDWEATRSENRVLLKNLRTGEEIQMVFQP